MANTKSAKKRARQTPKKTARNTRVRSEVKSAIRGAREGAAAKEGLTFLKLAVSKIQKAANKGVIHQKNASRKISRLMKLIAKNSTAQKAAEVTEKKAPAKKATAAKKPAAKTAAKRTSAKK